MLSNQFTNVSTYASVRGGSPVFSISRQQKDKENVYGTDKATAFQQFKEPFKPQSLGTRQNLFGGGSNRPSVIKSSN
jgi:hypothetical protein